MSVMEIADLTLPIHDDQCSDARDEIALMRALPFDNCSEMIPATWYAVGSTTDSSMESALAEQHGRNVVKAGLYITLLDVLQRCSPVHYLNADGGHEWAERSLHIIQVTHRDGKVGRRIEEIKLS